MITRLFLKTLQRIVEREFRTVVGMSSPALLPALLRKNDVDVVLLDMNFGAGKQTGGDGLFWLDHINRQTNPPAVVLITAFGNVELAVTSLKRLLCAEPGHDSVHYNISGELLLKADPNLLLLALLNLIRNALQAIDGQADGWVRVEAATGAGSTVITVMDNGPGIPAQWLEAVFTPFFSTKAEGSGIGLSLSRRIMQLHNGLLTVESEPGMRTVFAMYFP